MVLKICFYGPINSEIVIKQMKYALKKIQFFKNYALHLLNHSYVIL